MLKGLMYLVGIYILVNVVLYILKFFKEFIEETWQVYVGIGAIFVLAISIQQLYVFNDLLGICSFILVFVFLLFYLHKKRGIVNFFKSITGIDEYNKDEVYWKKALKILYISSTIFIFSIFILGMFTVLIETIFLHIS